jgi:hypothetical protein
MATTSINDTNPPTTIFSGWQFLGGFLDGTTGHVKKVASHDGVVLTDEIFRSGIEWLDPTYRGTGFGGGVLDLYYLRATTVSGVPPVEEGQWQELGNANFQFGENAGVTWLISSFEVIPGYIPDTAPSLKEGVCKVEISDRNDGTNILAVGYYGGGAQWTSV